ncbi:hypothetical protein YC2023_101784 [Brassica napus]
MAPRKPSNDTILITTILSILFRCVSGRSPVRNSGNNLEIGEEKVVSALPPRVRLPHRKVRERKAEKKVDRNLPSLVSGDLCLRRERFLVRGGCTQPVQMWVLKFSWIWSDNLPSEASEVIDLPIIFTAFCPLRSFREKNSYFFKTTGYILRRPGSRVSGFDSGLWWLL